MPRLALLLLLSFLVLPACSSDTKVAEQTVTVACGACQFGMEDAGGCKWAAEIDGQHYMVNGPLPHDHNSHAPDGMCNMKRQAKVAGTIRDDLFVASSFELLPAEGVPEQPKFDETDTEGH